MLPRSLKNSKRYILGLLILCITHNIDFAKSQDNNFGKWQDLPLSCYVCNGNDCDDLVKSELVKCADNNEQDCIVVFDENGKVTARGCSDTIEESYCGASGNQCINCKSNQCNTATSLDEIIDCVYCDSFNDLNCLLEPESTAHNKRKCHGGCMTALYPVDLNENPSYELIRTCLDDKDPEDYNICSNGLDENCRACREDNCNIVDLPEDRLECFYCINSDCEDPSSIKCPLHKDDDYCFIWFDNTNSVSEMGCLSSFRNQNFTDILKTRRVFVCNDGENCNSLDKLIGSQKCAVCDSQEDELCAVNAKLIGDYKDCNILPNTGCFSQLRADGTTVRGCQTDLDDENFVNCILGKDHLCGTCSGDACNNEVFPPDRQQCFTCMSSTDANCESFPTRSQPCPIVSESESCITALSDNDTIRGCSSEFHCDAGDRLTCRSCFGTQCNAIDLKNKVEDSYNGAFQDLPLSCHKCDGEHCKTSLGPVVKCTDYDKQDCMTVFESDGQVRRRGCSDNVDDYEDRYCREHPELCFHCKSNECNIAWSLDEYVECTFCQSSQNVDCVQNPETALLDKRKCRKECLVTIINTDEILRSCLDDKEVFDQVDCRAQNNNNELPCSSCDTENCNTFVYPSDRLKCHVCKSPDCSTSEGQYCLKYDENDFCFAKYEDETVDLLGCASSQSQSNLEQWENENKLYRCSGNECNDLTKLPTDESSCVVCNSSEKPQCAQDPLSITDFESCDKRSNECVIRIDENGATLRGCFDKVEDTVQESCVRDGTCVVCTGDKCNTAAFPADRRKCHICSSDKDESCAKSPNSLLICPKYANNDLCVSKLTNGITRRGCASDFTCDENDKDNCEICNSNGCNVAELGNGVSMFSGSLLLVIITTFLTLYGFAV